MKKILLTVIVLCFSTTLAWAKSYSIDVKMKCEKCAANIETALNEKYPGKIKNFKATPETDNLTLDSETLTEDQIKAVIHNAGYTLINK